MKLRIYLSVFILFFVIFTDQIIKVLVKTNMCLFDKIEITDWFYIFFTENKGMAFGMEFLGTGILTIFRIFAVGFFSYFLVKQIKQMAPIGFITCLAMIIAGAFGNIIDNCFFGLCFSESIPRNMSWDMPAQFVGMGEGYGSFLHGHVVDMFYFPLFRWPEWLPLIGGNVFFGAVFNFADASISVGAAMMFLLYYKHVSQIFSGKDKAEERS
ncbi:lipoprotein signal peptidase [Alloprevotella sp. OH1205_COT-284]|uniref:lipoprotein signal peptidase n=1 Tax=Alloprevotella sp. OH1205_COT-284 TaxID=2491043 RepID=UPI000F5F1833|nr:lipoprotein signal peptidase [Alloprevotella sp. OH1205_COT-284]RRD77408.1 lipoprotein signal peptidase [Alloprevotella sp. OH1205_COT-284]